MKKKKPYWVRAGKLTLAQRMAMLIFGVLTFYFLVRTLNKEDYGTWMLFLSTTVLLHMAREGFFKKPLIRYINRLEGEEKMRLQCTSFFLNLLFSLVSSTSLVVISGFLSERWNAPALQELFYIYFFTNLGMAVFSHCNNVLEAHFRFKGPLVGNFLKVAVLFAIVVFYYYSRAGLSLATLGFSYLASVVIASAAMFWYSRDLLAYRFRWSRLWARKLLSYGKFTLGTNISGVFLRNTDIWMIGFFLTPSAVAVYNVAVRIANLFEVPTMAMASIIFPQAVKRAEAEGEGALKLLYEKSVTVIMLLVAPMAVLVILFSNELVWLLAGEGYEEAGWILNITMLYGLIIPFNKQMGVLLDAIGKARLNMLFVIRNVLINLVLNGLMIPILGIRGAAYATLITFLISLVLNQFYLKKAYGVEFSSLFRYSVYYVKKARQSLFRQPA